MSYLLSMDYQMSEAVRGRTYDRRSADREAAERPDGGRRNGAADKVNGSDATPRFRGFTAILGLDWLGRGS